MPSWAVIHVAIALVIIIGGPVKAVEQPKLTAHVCKGTLIDQRKVGVSLGDCDLNDLAAVTSTR